MLPLQALRAGVRDHRRREEMKGRVEAEREQGMAGTGTEAKEVG